MPPPDLRARIVWFERIGVALLLAAAAVPRARDLFAPWDREIEGWQGAFFTTGAINYERLGVGLLGGYPIVNIDLPPDPRADSYTYPNHPPTVPLLTWASLQLFGPAGWNEAWRRGEAPPAGTETAARVPFLGLHLLGLLVLWWAVRQASGRQIAMLALAVAAATPVSALYATLVNYENPFLFCILLGCGFHARFLRSGARRDLLGTAGAFFLGSAVSFHPAFFVPPLVVQTLGRRGWRDSLREGVATGFAALVPLFLHGLWVRSAVSSAHGEAVTDRAARMLQPLFSGAAPFPEWLRRQGIRLDYFLSTPILIAASAGLFVLLWRAAAPRRDRDLGRPAGGRRECVSLGLPLLAGGFLAMLGFYRHTWDGEGVHGAQTIFLMNLAPAAAVLAATALDALSGPLLRLRGGIAPLVLVASFVVLPGVLRTNEIRHRWRAPGPADDPAEVGGPAYLLPKTAGEQIAEILPAGAIGFYPRDMGFTVAVAYYAWRTLLPVADEESYERALGVVIAMHGLEENPRYILLPRHPPAGAEAQVDSIRAIVETVSKMEKASAHWELWPVQ
ncbi:MAG: glycosyltransferase family 39 protein [Planctomycetota bacterium]